MEQISRHSGVYLEKVLKESNTSVWMQNIRLALIGLPMSVASMWFYDGEHIQKGGTNAAYFFCSYSILALLSIAIIGAAIGSWMLFDFVPGFFFSLGAMFVMVSIIMYTMFPYEPPGFDFRRLSAFNSNLLMIKPSKGAEL
ncbi:unnamed protein product [Heligmosomoides polygyrus]|uniref:Transmembrane protein n=1 Tax=Heligmosomoides polygyrus TaxID=6339 RepID=A0A183GHK2_HELPZ|nr:unnamed protein product [Heligmosomoides polygyrus]